jgi:hypothetical protein
MLKGLRHFLMTIKLKYKTLLPHVVPNQTIIAYLPCILVGVDCLNAKIQIVLISIFSCGWTRYQRASKINVLPR